MKKESASLKGRYIAKWFRGIMQLAYLFTNNSQLTRNYAQMKYSLYFWFLCAFVKTIIFRCVLSFRKQSVSGIKQNYTNSFLVPSNVIIFLSPNCKDGFACDYEKNLFFFAILLAQTHSNESISMSDLFPWRNRMAELSINKNCISVHTIYDFLLHKSRDAWFRFFSLT